uniref:RNA-directed DNA polymerase n=1 Tax=Strongyloides papillosus TaxID=174720 RepID=A0A0N5B5K2_STREA
SEYLSTMDVSAAYKALPLDEHSKELTCFYTPYGIYKAETLPFGLATAPALFVAEIRKSLKMIKSTNFTFYMDDFLFYGPVAQQIQAIKEVTEALTKRGWSWNLEKCEILKPQVHFIGYLISGTEWEIPDEKIKKLLDMTPPKNAKELASLRGKLLYFSRLIPEFGAITSVWDGSKFRWEEDEQKAFETIMSILKRNPKITTIPEGAQVVVVVVNQHKNSISSALYWFTDKSYGVACWCSRKSTATERNYSVLDRWTVAIYEMMNQPQQSRRIRPPYDEEMLGHPKSKRVCGMLFTLSLMNLEPINLPKAKDDVVALSLGVLEQCYSIKKDEKENIGHLKLTTVENELIQEARADLDYMNMFKGVFDGVYRHLEKYQLSLTGERNVMALNGKLIVPVGSGKRIVAKIHKDYHEGTRNLTNRINTNFIIHGLTKLIKEVIAECKICQMFRKNGPCKTLIWTPAVEPRERGHMDFFFFSGKTIFLLTDSFSAYPFAKVIKRKSDFLEVLKEIVALFGDFELLVSDNEPVFQSEEVAGWLEERGTLHFFVPTYSPRSNGLAEGMVNILKNKMKKAQEEMNLNVEESLTWALISVRTVSDYKGMSRIDKFVGKRSMGKKWFQDIRFESVSQPVYFKVSPNQTWTEGQLIWTIGQRIKGVLADGIVHMLPAERVHGRKEDLKEVDDDSAVNDEQVVSSNQEITQLLKNGGFKYPAGVFFTDGSTKQENGYGVVGLLLPEEGKVKVKVYAQRGIKHGSCGPSANRLEIMAVKVALEIAQDMNLQQVYIFSDSRNLTGAYSEGWIDNWRDNGFSRLSNSSLYKAVDDLVQKIPQVHIKRVAAHNGVFLNECADELAKGGDPDEITNKVNNWLKSKLCETSPEEEVEEEKDPDE